MADEFVRHYLEDATASFRAYKKLAEKALDQLSEEQYFQTIDDESNSVAVIMKHIAGNSISRWTDFLTTDGEKPNRNRDSEFIIEPQTSKQEITEYWERGWQTLFSTLESLGPQDFDRKVTIRSQEHTIVQAINRQLTHYAYHIGQIVFLAKHLRSADWHSLSIPKGSSAAVNARMAAAPGQASTEGRFDTSRIDKEK
jgi:uncharacterized damage-inducible protein DinB